MNLAVKIFVSCLSAGLALFALLPLGGPGGAVLLVKLAAALVVSLISALSLLKIFSHEFSRLEEDISAAKAGRVMRCRPSFSFCAELEGLYARIDGTVRELREKSLRVMDLEAQLKEKSGSLREARSGEDRFRKLFDNANDAFFIYRGDGQIADVNEKACEMVGYRKQDLLKMSFLDLYTGEELQRPREARVIDPRTNAIRFESEFRRRDGHVILVEISSSTIDPEQGLVQATATNITEKKELEKALKESEAKFRTFMETASDIMFIADRDGNLRYVNSAMIKCLGYASRELAGMNIGSIIDQDSKDVFLNNRFELSKKGEVTYETVWEAKNRRKINGEMKETAMYDADGMFSGSRGVFRDVSERKKVEKVQRLAQLGELAANVAHEVNNPVMIISGRAEMLLMEVKDERQKEELKIILDQCERTKDMVQRLLKFSRPSKGDFREADINSTVENTVKLLESQFCLYGVIVVRRYGDALPAVKMDEKLMQEVFVNILRNAQEAMPKGGTVTVATSVDDGFIRVDFSDTGMGISEEDMKRIFDPFFTTKENGIGLGLLVCYGIAKAHGGELRYVSEPGKGTTATVMLPLVRPADAE